ncbi:MAG: cytochrome c oxidase assembly protein [Alphaproteobacteria bacterium]|nr:cytochrome c oxidase assembly protein [Alphaproteobacteria bacterium]
MVTPERKNSRVAALVGLVAVGMVGMAYAAVPLYELFCKVTGYGGTTQRAEVASGEVLDRDMKVRFNASVHRDMPWDFKPIQISQEVKVGEQMLAHYEAFNPTDKTIVGTATFNVTPHKAGEYFAKVDCFCFTEQVLKPGERIDMPVVYFIDPLIAEDPNLDEVSEVTLSYTFFVMEDEKAVQETANSR